jgi:hypothetical protein
MRPQLRSVPLVVVGTIGALMIGVAAVIGLLGWPTRPGGSPEMVPLTATIPTATVAPTVRAGGIAQSTPNVAPTSQSLTSTPTTPAHPVELSLDGVDQLSDQGGLAITVGIANNRSVPLVFRFDPAYDVQVHDARGKSLPLRWAEYHGVETVPALATTQLTHAFFAADVANAATWPLTVAVDRVPGAGQVVWRAPKTGTPTVDTTARPAPPPPPPDSTGPVTASVINPLPSSELGGVQVDVQIQNTQATDLVFQFDPNHQLSAVDNLSHTYYVRWAQYDGTVRVPAHSSAQLARVFFGGPIDNGNPAWLKITLRQVPGGKPVTASTPLG